MPVEKLALLRAHASVAEPLSLDLSRELRDQTAA